MDKNARHRQAERNCNHRLVWYAQSIRQLPLQEQGKLNPWTFLQNHSTATSLLCGRYQLVAFLGEKSPTSRSSANPRCRSWPRLSSSSLTRSGKWFIFCPIPLNDALKYGLSLSSSIGANCFDSLGVTVGWIAGWDSGCRLRVSKWKFITSWNNHHKTTHPIPIGRPV